MSEELGTLDGQNGVQMTITRFCGPQFSRRLQLTLHANWIQLDEEQTEQLIEYLQDWVKRMPTKDHP